MTAATPAIVFDVGAAPPRRAPRRRLGQLLSHEAAADAFAAKVDFPARDAGRGRDDGVTAPVTPGPGAPRR